MNLTLWNYGLLPVLVYVPSLFVLVFLVSFKVKVSKQQRFFVASTFTGFIGFSITFALPFYQPLRFSYTLVPIAFFLLGLIGFLGCLLTNVNPFDVKTPLFAPKPKKKRIIIEEIEEEEKPFVQTVREANKLIDLLLFKLGQPYYSGMKMATNGGEPMEFPFIVTSPNGLFLIYPCNWSGEILFADNGAKKILSTPSDGEDVSSSIVFREAFFKHLLDTIGLIDTPVKSIICATNPSAVVRGEPTKYIATELGDLTSLLRKTRSDGKLISATNLYDIQNAIELNQIKK